jgi:hypothetical protein
MAFDKLSTDVLFLWKSDYKVECDVGTQYGIHAYGLHCDSQISFETNMPIDQILINV